MAATRALRIVFGTRAAIVAALAVVLCLTGCAAPDKDEEARGWSADKLYAEANDALEGGDYPKAERYFELLESRFPFGALAQQSQLNAAYAYYKDNEPEQAIAAINRFIQMHPDHPRVDYAWYLKGLINFNDNLGWLGRFSNQDLSERDPKAAKASFEAFKTLVARYPNSPYAADATARMKYLVNSLALHEVHAARYYFSRGAYVAAVNRAQQAVRDYPGAPAVEEALTLLVKSYDQLGMTTLRDDAKRVLEANYPNSEFLEGKTSTRVKRWWQIW